MSIDEKYMRLAINLAKRAMGMTSPNPLVGAVIVKGDRIIATGYHKACGQPHAEINALAKSPLCLKGATLYVTLEPCDHYAHTPPCTNAIIKSGMRKVVIAMKDPNPINNGAGIKKLKRHGIKTITGVLEAEARSLNKPYIKYITRKIPYITVKTASSLDGKIATRTGRSRWITGKAARQYVHELRAKVDAVMVGVNTVINDDPLLLSETSKERQPMRIVVDSHLKTPLEGRIFSEVSRSPVIIATTNSVSQSRAERYEERGAKVLFVKSKGRRVDLVDLMRHLGRMEITHILVEGGGELIGNLIEAGLVDRFLFFLAPMIIGGRTAVTSVEGIGVSEINDAPILKDIKIKRFADDILVESEVR